MTAVSLKKILTDANKNNYAVAGLVVLAWDDALAFTKAADETGVPIILQAGPSCRTHTPVPIFGKMFRHLAAQTKTHTFNFMKKTPIDVDSTYILRRPQNFAKSLPYFCPM